MASHIFCLQVLPSCRLHRITLICRRPSYPDLTWSSLWKISENTTKTRYTLIWSCAQVAYYILLPTLIPFGRKLLVILLKFMLAVLRPPKAPMLLREKIGWKGTYAISVIIVDGKLHLLNILIVLQKYEKIYANLRFIKGTLSTAGSHVIHSYQKRLLKCCKTSM